MATKDYTQVNKGKAFQGIAAATKKRKDRPEYTGAERAEIMETMKTSGKKGCGLPRINLAFRPSTYDYIQTMSKASGMTMTDFINVILQEHMDAHEDLYKQALAFRKALIEKE